jgi:STE24 endopeptidase
MLGVFLLSLAFLALLGALLHTPWFFAALGVNPGLAGDTALALILFALVVPLFAFFFTPLFSHLSRRDEFQADAYAVKTSSATELAEALVKLYEDNASTLTPDPLHSRFYDSHPPAMERVARLLGRPASDVHAA